MPFDALYIIQVKQTVNTLKRRLESQADLMTFSQYTLFILYVDCAVNVFKRQLELMTKRLLKLLGPVVQSIVRLTNSIVVNMLQSQVVLLKKCEYLLQMKKLLTLFSAKNISVYGIF